MKERERDRVSEKESESEIQAAGADTTTHVEFALLKNVPLFNNHHLEFQSSKKCQKEK